MLVHPGRSNCAAPELVTMANSTGFLSVTSYLHSEHRRQACLSNPWTRRSSSALASNSQLCLVLSAPPHLPCTASTPVSPAWSPRLCCVCLREVVSAGPCLSDSLPPFTGVYPCMSHPSFQQQSQKCRSRLAAPSPTLGGALTSVTCDQCEVPARLMVAGRGRGCRERGLSSGDRMEAFTVTNDSG